MITFLVTSSRSCVKVYLDLVPLLKLCHQHLAGHGVLVIVYMVLVIEACQLLTITSQRDKNLLSVLEAD
jgi:hypothetical protein